MGLIASLMSYYYVAGASGQTLGMKAWRLRLQRSDGSLATAQQCLKRCPGFISLAAFGLGYFAVTHRQKYCAHDLFTARRDRFEKDNNVLS